MIKKLSEKILTVLIRNQGVKENQRDIVLFGIEQGIVTALEIILLLITSAILGSVVNGVIILLAFTTIRIYAGGYHAKTQIGCVIRTWIFFVIVILCQSQLDVNVYIREAIMIWSLLILIWICPLENEKRKFVGNPRKHLQKKSNPKPNHMDSCAKYMCFHKPHNIVPVHNLGSANGKCITYYRET